MTADLLTAWKKISVGMYWNICKQIWFKLDMMTHSVELNILNLV